MSVSRKFKGKIGCGKIFEQSPHMKIAFLLTCPRSFEGRIDCDQMMSALFIGVRGESVIPGKATELIWWYCWGLRRQILFAVILASEIDGHASLCPSYH